MPASYSADDVRSLRDDIGWSREELASYVGVSRALIGHWETGHCEVRPVYDRLLDDLRDAAKKLRPQP